MPDQAPAVACVLRRGNGEYRPEHVIALYRQVARWWPTSLGPLRFVCLTDQAICYEDGGYLHKMAGLEERPLRTALPGWWAKLELCSAEHDDLGDLLYFDLDTMIVGDLGRIADVARLTLLRDFYRPERAQSGMMYLPKEIHPEVQAVLLEEPAAVTRRARGDGEFLHDVWGSRAARWQDVRPGLVLSYKVHVRPNGERIPAGTSVVCFHGYPRPWQTRLVA